MLKQVAHKMRLVIEGNWWPPEERQLKILKEQCMNKEKKEKAWGFFNRSYQRTLSICEVGVVLLFDSSYYLLMKYVIGQKDNNPMEFYVL